MITNADLLESVKGSMYVHVFVEQNCTLQGGQKSYQKISEKSQKKL